MIRFNLFCTYRAHEVGAVLPQLDIGPSGSGETGGCTTGLASHPCDEIR